MDVVQSHKFEIMILKGVRTIGVVVIFVILMLMMGSLPACDQSQMIPLIGFDEHGNSAQAFISEKQYITRLKALTQTVSDSTLPVLVGQSDSAWSLRVLAFGIGVNAQVGIGPVQVGAFPQVRFVFSNIKSSFVP